MKRAVSSAGAVGFGLIVNAASIAGAAADCQADIRMVRGEIGALKDDRRRQELEKLVEKAEKDDQAGRARLCAEAVQRARVLLRER